MNRVLRSTKFIVDNSKFVRINKEKVEEFSRNFQLGKKIHWLSQAPVDFSGLSMKQELNFTFIFQALSFCYWGEPKWTIEENREKYDGAWAMVIALGRAMKKHDITDFEYCSQISEKDFAEILQGNIEIPLFKERLNILHEIGDILTNKYQGDLEKFIAPANQDALALLDILTKEFPSFYDSSMYDGKEIFFHKRAQLLISDICELFKRQDVVFKNVDQLTACADYKLPQILRRLGIFEYSDHLKEKIDNKIEIVHGSEEEIEIRASTIWAVEHIKEKIIKNGINVISMEVDDYLFSASQKKSLDDKPYHRTRTIAY